MVEAGVPLRNVEHDTMISMFVSDLACVPAWCFHGPMVVTMRPIAECRSISFLCCRPAIRTLTGARPSTSATRRRSGSPT